MLVKTSLSRIHKLKSFVYDKLALIEKPAGMALLVSIVARTNSKPVCSNAKARARATIRCP